MTDTFTIADHHFENAGIEPEEKQEVIEGQATEVEGKQDETNLESGTENPVKELQDKQADKVDPKSATAGKDKSGSGTDDGKKEEPKKEEPQPNRSEAELDAAALDEAKNAKPVRPEIAQRWMHQRDTARQERDSTKNALERTTQELTQAKAQVEAFRTAATAMGELPPAEMPGAVRLYSALKQNPVATLKQLLVEAKANGHTIDGIGEGVDTAAINRLLDQRLKPFEQNNGSQNQSTPSSEPRTVDNDDDLFLQQFPDASPHIDIMVDMLNRNIADKKAGKTDRIMGNTELYFTLKNAAIAQGFDFSKPLQPQIDARKSGTAPAIVPAKVEEKVDPTPRLSGRGEGGTEPLIQPGAVDESFGDIVKRALAQSKVQN